MPPGNYGPPGDPLGLGPVGGFGPPPGPQYPVPGPYGAAQYQPAPTGGGAGGRGGPGGMGDNGLGYGEAPRWWFDAEYLLWFTRDQQVNTPLLTTSAPANGGLVGSASTTVLVGNRDLNYGAISGYRLTAGFYGDADRRFGFQLSGFSTERKSNSRRFGALSSTASGIPVLARPFVDVNGVPSAVVLSGPDSARQPRGSAPTTARGASNRSGCGTCTGPSRGRGPSGPSTSSPATATSSFRSSCSSTARPSSTVTPPCRCSCPARSARPRRSGLVAGRRSGRSAASPCSARRWSG